jgi:hypothetical protein
MHLGTVQVLRVRTSEILSVVIKSMGRTYKVSCPMRIRTYVKIFEKKDENFVLHFRLLITARGTGLSVFKNKIVMYRKRT